MTEQKLREALQKMRRYVAHNAACALHDSDEKCTCGLTDLLKVINTFADTPLTDAEVERLYGPLSDTFGISLAGRFSNFARTLERALHAKERELAELVQLKNILILCGEEECRNVEGSVQKLRALIDGLITAKSQLAAIQSVPAAGDRTGS